MLCQAQFSPPTRIQLPRSSSRLYLPYVYLKMLADIVPLPFGMARFEGAILRPGLVVDLEKLPRPAVIIECAGPIGVAQRGKHRDYLYILWLFDYHSFEWREVGRAQAQNSTWTGDLREAAWRCLHPRPELVDIIQRSLDLSEELVSMIDKRLQGEMPEVTANALHAIYERVAGKLADCA